jgi:pyruvate/2-oxoglutarate dehydrogenase complex dihydrolipoamide dehydrogenase (E3) component
LGRQFRKVKKAMLETQRVGGSCPNVACLPRKNIIHSAKGAQLCRRGAEFGMRSDPAAVDMVRVRDRKRRMVEELQLTDGAQ